MCIFGQFHWTLGSGYWAPALLHKIPSIVAANIFDFHIDRAQKVFSTLCNRKKPDIKRIWKPNYEILFYIWWANIGKYPKIENFKWHLKWMVLLHAWIVLLLIICIFLIGTEHIHTQTHLVLKNSNCLKHYPFPCDVVRISKYNSI